MTCEPGAKPTAANYLPQHGEPGAGAVTNDRGPLPVQDASALIGATEQLRVSGNDAGDGARDTQRQVLTSAKITGVEASDIPVAPGVLALTFMSPDEHQFPDFRQANSTESHQQELQAFTERCNRAEIRDRCIFIVITTSENGQPMIGNKIVSEALLYGKLNLSTRDQPHRTRVFVLTCQSSPPNWQAKSEKPAAAGSSQVSEATSKRAAYSGTELYRIQIGNPSGTNLRIVHQELNLLFSSLANTDTLKITGGQKIIELIVKNCSNASLCLERVSVIPDGSGDPIFDIQRLHVNCFASPELELNTGVNIICFGIVISYYPSRNKKFRLGSAMDKTYVEEIARLLGCSDENTHLLCDDDGNVSHNNKDIIKKLKRKYEGKAIQDVVLIVSGHGDKDGLLTSFNKKVPLIDFVEPMRQLGSSGQLFYQACRGSRSHPTVQTPLPHESSYITGALFDSPDSSGSCLPISVPNFAAIFASMAGYKSYRHHTGGSLMLLALRNVLESLGIFERRATPEVAKLLQRELNTLEPNGIHNAFVQVQFYENYLIKTKPDVQLELESKPSQEVDDVKPSE